MPVTLPRAQVYVWNGQWFAVVNALGERGGPGKTKGAITRAFETREDAEAWKARAIQALDSLEGY